jgi:hypothetical protein
MEYLKSYKVFEGKVTSDDLIKIKELCNNSLAYLLDDGFLVSVKGVNTIYINITKSKIDNIVRTFKWNEIKDEVIPLFLLLQDKIGIISFFKKSNDFNSYKEYYYGDTDYNNLLEGNDIEDTNDLRSIEIELN